MVLICRSFVTAATLRTETEGWQISSTILKDTIWLWGCGHSRVGEGTRPYVYSKSILNPDRVRLIVRKLSISKGSVNWYQPKLATVAIEKGKYTLQLPAVVPQQWIAWRIPQGDWFNIELIESNRYPLAWNFPSISEQRNFIYLLSVVTFIFTCLNLSYTSRKGRF